MFSYSSFAKGNLASRFLQTERLFLVVGEWSRDEDECVCYSKRQSSRSRTPPTPHPHPMCGYALCTLLQWPSSRVAGESRATKGTSEAWACGLDGSSTGYPKQFLLRTSGSH